ncbi:MAG: two-component system, response regulator PdtaR [Pseudomonadota bacterium]|jgi:CheY-like chemotaxis protein|nr:two-component system, response regulator PdtaR [Pseudomonadota bacterium]MDQ5903937.1 two-component system, response regulator PdtaR [Pseudomonadota bacterium]MDQ5915437.1 two-component system, response regulator PdtaR [Pseudomonadota bacterium]MDQ5919213.1 two-component system, response regulator PdtaR [Pseudomonadota bacterium]MDQ5960922.1 two-component system, response regulator PdtaR [Pseudomonadota bacterium]
MKILIVDDNVGLCKVLTALCVSAGHEVVGTQVDGNGVEEAVLRLQPDMLCLDYNLPGRDGLAILAAVQAQMPSLDVIFMTGSEETGIEQKAADAGASGFIRKPFSQSQIIDELREVTEARRLAAKTDEVSVSEALPESEGLAAGMRCIPRTAVIADDSASVRMVLKGLLEESGLRVVQTVGNGAEAINAVKAKRPAVLCLDVNMPVMAGLEALPQIREISPETAVVMVTGCADRDFVTEAASLGAKGYILKPLRPAYVLGFMKKLLG